MDFNIAAYWCLAFLRIILVCIPQTGYIHPDEYFQSVEVFAGRLFNVEANYPWEFNSTFPVRSVALSYLTIGASLKMLKNINYFVDGMLVPYFILIFPRLLMCFLSFIVDHSVYKICVDNNERYNSKLLILASSYVILIHGTRTFSNTLELILFALLLYYVAESLTFSNNVCKKREYLNLRYNQSKNPVDRVKWNKLRSYLKSDTLRNCFYISVITVFGFFNRPTFLAFAAGPVFFWLYRGIGTKIVAPFQFHLRSFVILLCSLPTIITIIVIDSFFYGYISWGEIGMLDVTINSFVFTPLNFVKYNMDTKNLAEHGLHPRFLHVLINVPLLFNILGFCGIVGILTMSYRVVKCQYQLLPTVRSLKGLMITSMTIPAALLSIFPHQEPRFLIPITVPLVYLHADDILTETDNTTIKITGSSQINKKHKSTSSYKNQNYLMKFWLFINAVCVIFYGFIHQGGIYPMLSYLSQELQTYPLSSTFHIFTSHIYSIPESLLLQRRTDILHISNNTKYMTHKRVFLHEEGSSDLELLLNKVVGLIETHKNKFLKSQLELKVYIILPSSLKYKLNFALGDENYKTLRVNLYKTFYPHLSTEALPNFSLYCLDVLPFYECKNGEILEWRDYVSAIAEFCALDLYTVL